MYRIALILWILLPFIVACSNKEKEREDLIEKLRSADVHDVLSRVPDVLELELYISDDSAIFNCGAVMLETGVELGDLIECDADEDKVTFIHYDYTLFFDYVGSYDSEDDQQLWWLKNYSRTKLYLHFTIQDEDWGSMTDEYFRHILVMMNGKFVVLSGVKEFFRFERDEMEGFVMTSVDGSQLHGLLLSGSDLFRINMDALNGADLFGIDMDTNDRHTLIEYFSAFMEKLSFIEYGSK